MSDLRAYWKVHKQWTRYTNIWPWMDAHTKSNLRIEGYKVNQCCDYGQDVGNLHVIDYIITKARVGKTPWPGFESSHLRISPADWSRS